MLTEDGPAGDPQPESAELAKESPELLLAALNQSLLQLTGALSVLSKNDSDDLQDACREVLRRTVVAQTLASRHMIAVAGPHGSGKTTLVKALYEVDDTWLRPFEGRGETMPVFVLEDDEVSAPQGRIMLLVPAADGEDAFTTDTVAVTPPEWTSALTGSRSDALLAELHVPPSFFPGTPAGTAGLLLLPGYEKQVAENRLWQELMRQALVGAAAVLLVTSGHGLATNLHDPATVDLRERYLRDARPLVAITHCEAESLYPEDLAELVESAVAAFNCPPGRIFCTWRGPGSAEPLGKLRTAIRDLGAGGGLRQEVRLRELEQTVNNDLGALLGRVTQAVEDHADQSLTGPEQALAEVLVPFDEAVDALRQLYDQRITGVLNMMLSEVLGRAATMHAEEIEGAANMGNRVVNVITFRPSRNTTKIDGIVAKAWRGQADGPTRLAAELPRILAELVQRQLRLSGITPTLKLNQNVAQRIRTVPTIDDEASAKPASATAVTSGPVYSAAVQKAVVMLLTGDRAGIRTQARDELKTAVELLPAMAMEWARLGSSVPEFVGLDPATLEPIGDKTARQVLDAFKEALQDWGAGQKALVATLAGIAGVEQTAGDIKTIEALIAASRGRAGAEFAGAAARMVGGAAAAGAVAVVTIDMINRRNWARFNAIQRRILGLYQAERDERLRAFDDLMRLTRGVVTRQLRRSYGLDEMFGRREWLRWALESTKSRRLRLLDAIGEQPATLG